MKPVRVDEIGQKLRNLLVFDSCNHLCGHLKLAEAVKTLTHCEVVLDNILKGQLDHLLFFKLAIIIFLFQCFMKLNTYIGLIKGVSENNMHCYDLDPVLTHFESGLS